MNRISNKHKGNKNEGYRKHPRYYGKRIGNKGLRKKEIDRKQAAQRMHLQESE